MADLVVGMAKSVVDGALTKAQAAIEEEAKLRTSAQRNLVFIAGEFQMMQSFLNVADGERLNNVVVRTWVRQIRDLAYDVEDCIEFVVHLDKRNRWWLRLLEPWRWVVPCCLAPLELDEAVAELERLKARVDDVSARNERYRLISDSGTKPDAAGEQPASGDAAGATAFDRIIVAAGTQKASLTKLLTKKESGGDLRVISVWGSGGASGDLGTTSAVRTAYIDRETCSSFDCRAWVKLRRPFNPDEFVQSLMSQFIANTCKEQPGTIVALDARKKMEEAKQDDLLAEFGKYVNEKRFLVILEDLSSMEEWDAVTTFFPKGGSGSVIVVSTLHYEVASLSVGHPYGVLHLSQSSAQNSVYAFYKMGSQQEADIGRQTDDPIKKEAEMWMKKNPLVGRESEIEALRVRAVGASRTYQILSVWGIAGVGKSALLKHVFCEKICQDKLFKKYAWAELSHPFNLWDFARRLLRSFDSEDLESKWTADHETTGSKNPIVECQEVLLRNKCFVVIDGLQSKKEWELIQDGLVSGRSPRTVIVVISSEESIAAHCRGPKGLFSYNVKGLETEAAYRLFLQVSHKNPSPGDNKLLTELLSKCGGIPKIIVEISKMIARRTIEWIELASSINNNFMQKLESNEEFGSLQGLFSWMQSYYRSCPDFLKPCIFYLSIFNPDQTIRRRRLVRRWIAEGYCRDSPEVSAEDNGERYFLSLLNLTIFEQPSTPGLEGTMMVSCKVSGFFIPLFRKQIISQQMEENFVFELDGNCIVTNQRTGRHLVISEKWDRDKIVFQSIDFSRLRSLTVLGKWESFFISESMKLLRVLDLEDAKEVKYSDVKNIVKWFPRLKFLSLRGQSKICHLPSSVGDLRQLQTLDVRHTSIVTLPVNITKLQNLQYIRAGKAQADNKPSTPVTPQGAGSNAPVEHEPSTSQVPLVQRENQQNSRAGEAQAEHNPSTPQGASSSTAPSDHKPSTAQHAWSRLSDYCRGRHLVGVEMPPGIGKMKALHTLGVVNIRASGTKAFLKDLQILTQLRKLGVSGINKSNCQKFFSAVKVLVHLESLSVQLDKCSEGCLEGIDKLPLENLRSLKLHGLGDKLPTWSQQLTKVTKIDLEMAKILKDRELNFTKEESDRQGKSIAQLKIENQGCMKFLGTLPELRILRIHAKQFEEDKLNVSVITNGIEVNSYQKLKILEIACSTKNSNVAFGTKAMSRLEQLMVDSSVVSNYKFSGVGNLIELREISLKGSNDEELEKDLESQLVGHKKGPAVKKLERSNWSSTSRC